MQNRFPAYVLKTLQILNAAGYEAYVVGGAVRDLLLGLEPGDYDITTSGRPEQVAAVLRAAGYSLLPPFATSAMPMGRMRTGRRKYGTVTH